MCRCGVVCTTGGALTPGDRGKWQILTSLLGPWGKCTPNHISSTATDAARKWPNGPNSTVSSTVSPRKGEHQQQEALGGTV